MTTSAPDGFQHLFAKVDELESHFINRLRRAIRIPSISAYSESREKCFEMAQMLQEEMTLLGIQVQLKDIGYEKHTGLKLPPIVLGRYGQDPKKPTILVYCHYDVQPAEKSDGWSTDPWEMTTEDDGRLCGRGTSDDKGPLLCWLNAIEAFQAAGMDVPVNLLFLFEGMEENGSTGLRAALEEEASQFLADVDAICISDLVWAGNTYPSIAQGLRGVLFYVLDVTGAEKDAHSGSFGGVLSEPMSDLASVMSSMVDSKGRILIPGIYDTVRPVTDEEKDQWEKLGLSEGDLVDSINGRSLHSDLIEGLVHRWRKPSLSLHRLENAAPGAGATTSIPAKVRGKFSIRTVPDMDSAEVDKLVQQHINTQFRSLGSKNSLQINCVHQSDWFFEDSSHWSYQAAINATRNVWDHEPGLSCEGGSIPIALDLKQVLKKNVLLLPIGRAGDGAHSINEKLDKIN
ncbi:unnamed protein product [Clonostachys solani]|uniref:Peptidase M20 dimerisation domain-containing protein n=1 Tax=Clonostachys solani TaxID=160281 RepID=A0A9P0EPX3_9HYPO|nr:unnamed protein product [Clonostachys solani]